MRAAGIRPVEIRPSTTPGAKDLQMTERRPGRITLRRAHDDKDAP
jgi:hypothetical protein